LVFVISSKGFPVGSKWIQVDPSGFRFIKHAKPLKVSRDSEELVKFRKIPESSLHLETKMSRCRKFLRAGYVSGLDFSQVLFKKAEKETLRRRG
jgi:hypothetical protein